MSVTDTEQIPQLPYEPMKTNPPEQHPPKRNAHNNVQKTIGNDPQEHNGSSKTDLGRNVPKCIDPHDRTKNKNSK